VLVAGDVVGACVSIGVGVGAGAGTCVCAGAVAVLEGVDYKKYARSLSRARSLFLLHS